MLLLTGLRVIQLGKISTENVSCTIKLGGEDVRLNKREAIREPCPPARRV
jgi:hypothetical protein